MKKSVLILILATMIAGGVFAQEAVHKHDAGDMLLGLNWSWLGAGISTTDPLGAFSDVGDSLNFDPVVDPASYSYSVTATIDLPKFYATARILNLGLSYEYYIFHWMSVGTGLGFGPEVNAATKGGKTSISITEADDENSAMQAAIDKALEVVHIQAGLFLTIPFNVHFNIPMVEWLYGGLGLEIHIPVSDAGLDSLLPADIATYLPGGSIKGKTFVSLPIDFGFDFSRVKNNGKPSRSRLLFRLEPEFFGNGMTSMPVSLVWQSSLWKLANVAIPGTK
ncbi:hypothetical protein FACS1894109_01320 [Spirochaetia bacterium]|nr:hypothetical protein FACS1894109_01320 [Spirochaetia bacterium]